MGDSVYMFIYLFIYLYGVVVIYYNETKCTALFLPGIRETLYPEFYIITIYIGVVLLYYINTLIKD